MITTNAYEEFKYEIQKPHLVLLKNYTLYLAVKS